MKNFLFLLLLQLAAGQKVAESDQVIKNVPPRRPQACGAYEPESCESPTLCIAGSNPGPREAPLACRWQH